MFIFLVTFSVLIHFVYLNFFAGPQLIISVYGQDTFGNDVVRGYGICHLPIQTGYSKKRYN